MYNVDDNQYIGSVDSDDLPNYAKRAVESAANYTIRTGQRDRWRKNYATYYAFDDKSNFWNSYVNGYARTDYIPLVVNHTKNIIKNGIMLALNQMPAFTCRATNTDPKVNDQIRIYNAQLERDAKEGWMERIIIPAALQASLYGTSFPMMEWDSYAGEKFTTMGADGVEEVVSTGDISADVMSVLDVFFDVTKRTWEEVDWVVVRQRVNKFKLAAIHPDFADDIINFKNTDDSYIPYYYDYNYEFTDDVFIYKFIHRDDPLLCPGGRYAVMLGTNQVLSDDRNKYGVLPLFPLSPMKQVYGVYGDTDTNDMYPIQKLHDAITGCLMTKITAFGIDKLVVDNNSLVDTEALTGGLKMFKMQPGAAPPRNLNLMGDLSGLTGLQPIAQKMLEDVSNMNAASRGAPDPSIKAGVMVSMLQSMAQRYNSSFQRDIFICMSNMMNHALKLRKKYATFEQTLKIVGSDKKFEVRRYTKEDISMIDSIDVEPVDPVTNTIGGQIMYADKLAQMGADIPTYTRALKTGRYEPMIDGLELEVNTAEMENSSLLKGESPLALRDENHKIHREVHKKMVSDVDAKKDKKLMMAYNKHMASHDQAELEQVRHIAMMQALTQQAQQEAMASIAPPQQIGMGDNQMGIPPPVNAMQPPAGQGPQPNNGAQQKMGMPTQPNPAGQMSGLQ